MNGGRPTPPAYAPMGGPPRESGSVEERAAWDAFFRDVFAAKVSGGQIANMHEAIKEVELAANSMIECRRRNFPGRPPR